MSNRVPYESALAELQSMFSGVDRDIIAMLLQSNGGVMERTVENLLSITGGAAPGDVQPPAAPIQPQSQRREEMKSSSVPIPVAIPVSVPSQQYQYQYNTQSAGRPQVAYPAASPQYYQQPSAVPVAAPLYHPQQPAHAHAHVPAPPHSHPPSYQVASARPAAAPIQSPPSSSSSDSLGDLISDDFLRPPSYFARKYPASSSGASPSRTHTQHSQNTSQMSQIDQDAILAQMLQDELFMQEVQQNPDRYQVNHQQQQQHAAARPAQSHAGSSTASSALTSPNPNASFSPVVPSGSASGHIKVEGIAGPPVEGHRPSSFADRWNLLTAATKKKFLSLAGKLKSNKQPRLGEPVDSEAPSDASYAALGDENPPAAPSARDPLYAASGPSRYFDDSGFEVAEDEGSDPDPFLATAKKSKSKRGSSDSNAVEMQSFGAQANRGASVNREPLLMEDIELNDNRSGNK